MPVQSWNEACTPGQCCFCQSGLCLQQAWLLSEIQKHCPWLEQYRCKVNFLKNMPHLPMYQGSQSESDWNHPRHRWCWYYLGSQCLDLNTIFENVKKRRRKQDLSHSRPRGWAHQVARRVACSCHTHSENEVYHLLLFHNCFVSCLPGSLFWSQPASLHSTMVRSEHIALQGGG